MTATTLHFGPEWMRTKQAPSRTNPSPPLTTSLSTGASSYSALVTPVLQAPLEKRDLAHPFRYSKEDLIRIYKEGGGKGGLGLEVERWDGIVRELGADPISLKEIGETEKKLFAGPLNSEMRRRPSTDYLSLSTPGLTERSKPNHTTTGPNSPLRERLGGYMGRRRDSTDQQLSLSLPRKVSQTSLQTMPLSPREALPSPRTRIPGTAGIDGVLSDSWHVRRKTSEGLLNSSIRTGEAAENGGPQATGIKEEDEEKGGAVNTDSGTANGTSGASQNEPSPAYPTSELHEPHPSANHVSPGIGKLSLNTNGNGASANGTTPSTPADGAPTGPPPGIVDLSTIEWSYLDPQGQVQGPFPAATMQKWYGDGYFTPNLLMKRTHLDTDWISVGEMIARVGHTRIFLTPIPNAPPPGLPRRDPLLDGPASDGAFASPFQPVPARALRTSAIDSYLHNGSLVPDSPSSTFSGGRFSNSSPDPTVFSGRLGGHHFNDAPVGPRLASLVSTSNEQPRRSTFDEPVDPTLVSRPSFGNYASGRTGSVDGLGYNVMETAGTVDSGPFVQQGHDSTFGARSAFHATRASQSSPMNNGQPTPGLSDFAPATGYREAPRMFNREQFIDRPDAQHPFANGGVPYSPSGQSFNQAQHAFGSQVDNRPLHSFIPDRQPITPLAQPRTIQQPFIPSPAVSSPWPPQDPSTLRRPGPFDPEYPTARNTVVSQPHRTITPSQSFSQVPPVPAAPAVTTGNDQSAWLAASQGAVSEGWTSDSLTAANLGHHNRQQEEQARQQDHPAAAVAESPIAGELSAQGAAPPADTSPEPPVVQAVEPETSSTKRRRKPSSQTPSAPVPQVATPSKHTSVPAPTVTKPPSPISIAEAAKQPAWGTGDDDKKKTSSVPLGLREIQEMETKKLEARKATERERERAARAAAASSSSAEEVQTLSWGLPTSQVGARSSTASKEPTAPQPSASPVVSSPPVWTTAAKAPVVKKTMKEIQEEEEKRKKTAAKEKETVAAAARRAYADTTIKAATPVQTGGAWTTVGTGGKVNAAVATPVARPTVTTSTSTKSVTGPTAAPALSVASVVSRTTASPIPTRSPVITTTVKLAPAKVEEPPSPPSHDFLKWMTDSLKGLNNSVNLEEITSMLLTFPLDPDPSTVEIISDLIYANSTTLDGRRFAAEFVSKRKVDSKGSAAAGRPLSIADVVKTQPKPVQNEWGGFKVVNKKKKTGRS